MRHAQELDVADDVAERRVLQQHDELGDDDRQHLPERLRELDEHLRLQRPHAEAEPASRCPRGSAARPARSASPMSAPL